MKRLNAVFKDPISGLTHLATALLALVGGVLLVLAAPANWPARVSVIAYGITLVLLFGASATYHLVKTTPARELWLRKLDHTAIFLLIAGTYTPICVIVLTGPFRWVLLAAIWGMALAGIGFKLITMRAPRWLSVVIYLVMGWLGVLSFGPLLAALPGAAMLWLMAGGLLYTLGALVYATKRLDFYPGVFGFHEVWHLFVTAASGAFYVFVLRYVLPFGLR
ncbi:MAG: hemolysin III family protein [Anaerolineales bacterium]